MARKATPRELEAFELIQVRVLEYAEKYNVEPPAMRLRVDLPENHPERMGRAVYHPKGVKYGTQVVRPDQCITFFDAAIIYDPITMEHIVAHEFLHHLEFMTNTCTHVQWGRTRTGRRVQVGRPDGQHAPEFYRKLQAMIDEMSPTGPKPANDLVHEDVPMQRGLETPTLQPV